MQSVTETPRIRVAIVEDDARFCATLVRAIEKASDMLLIACVGTLADGMQLLAHPAADVMLVDLGLPDGSGIALIHAARERWPDCEIMVSTVFGDEANVIQSIEAGAKGYLLKEGTPQRMVEEIRSLRAGCSPISPRIARHVLTRLVSGSRAAPAIPQTPSPSPAPSSPSSQNGHALSAREREVLDWITKGFTYDEIAHKMEISRHTVLTFVRRIYVKFEVCSKIEAINKARSQGLVPN